MVRQSFETDPYMKLVDTITVHVLIQFVRTVLLQVIASDQIHILYSACVGEKVQSLYSSLEVKDSEIYCCRAVMMYNCPEDITTGLFRFSMEHTKLTAMFDPSLLGEENLIKHLKEIDSQWWVESGVCCPSLV